jgi:hypothetical protein
MSETSERLQWRSLAQAATELEKIDWARAQVTGPWSVAEVLAHCAQSIECAVEGFPQAKPWLFRATVGRIALKKFLGQGYMSHDKTAAIPGAPAPEARDVAAALTRLRAAMAAFAAAPTLKPHFAYGPVERAGYDAVQAMHIADHVSSFTFAAPAPASA